MDFHRTFFVTTVTWQRIPLFRDAAKAETMMNTLAHYSEEGRYVLHEFVIMPDHLHLLITPAEDILLERALQLIKGGFSYRLGKLKRGLVWQESFTNHRIRDEHDFQAHAEYIRMNPVRARLVKRPEMYPYSSADATQWQSGSLRLRSVQVLEPRKLAQNDSPFRACKGKTHPP